MALGLTAAGGILAKRAATRKAVDAVRSHESPTGPGLGRRIFAALTGPAGFTVATAAATVAGAYSTRRAASLTKPVPMALLVARTAAGARSRPAASNLLLAGALAASMAGDRAMLLEEFTPPEDPAKDRCLQTGAGFFGLAQASYIGELHRQGARLELDRLTPRSLLMAESAVVLARHRPKLLPVLMTYGTALASMSATAADSPDPRLRIGGNLFVASDLTIVNRRHLISDPTWRRLTEAWVLASYFTAQYLLVTGLAEPRD